MAIPNFAQPDLDMDDIKLDVEHKFQDTINNRPFHHVSFSPSGDYVAASALMNHDIYVWERRKGTLEDFLEGPKEELGVVEVRAIVGAKSVRTLTMCSGIRCIYFWAINAPQRWSALAPDFAEVEENVEYVEREDEFDIHPIEEIHKRRLDLENETVDVLTVDPIKNDVEEDAFSMPVLLDAMDSDSEEEVVAVGPGTMRRKSPGEGRNYTNGANSTDEQSKSRRR
ncbi:MAG: hypothetical protein Q9173_001394 [Seirophora scorigena]